MSFFSLLLCLMVLVVASGFVYNGDAKEQKLGIYELKKGNFSAKFTNWGAAIVSVVVPDRHGKLADIALGYDTINEYINGTQSFGAVVGRVANRIAGAKFTLNGTQYKLIANDGNNTLHGGPKGFGKVAWRVSKYRKDGQTPHIVFSYRSVDGDQGFPGDLVAIVSYTLLAKNHLSVSLKAKALNKPTPVNLAQHVYWNLGGHNSGNILSNRIQIFGSQITPVDSQFIPTGKFSPVQGTPYDFLKPATIGSRMNTLPKGYNINYVLGNSTGHSHHKLKKAAIVHDDKTGRVLELLTNAPGVQFYTGNFLKNEKGKGGAVYQAHAALCLETQAFPDSVNHPNFPSIIIYPGKPYDHYMLFMFSTI